MRASICALVLLFLFASCNDDRKNTSNNAEGNSGDVLLLGLDTTVSPAEDFFTYANGAWLRNHPIPASETSWGIGHQVNEELYKRKRIINEEAVSKNASSGVDQQIAAFWQAGMDTVAIEKQGAQPLMPMLQKIDSISSKAGLLDVAAQMHRYGIGVMFGEFVTQDAKSSDVMAYYLWQGGLGMPNRDYYFNTDARTVKVRTAYPAYIEKLLVLSGVPTDSAKIKASNILALETALAKSARKLEDLRDPYANYNKMAVANLNTMSPSTSLANMMQTIGVRNVDSVIVGQPEFFKTLDNQIKTTSISTWKDYLRFHLLNEMAPYLSNNFSDARFEFVGKTIRGAEAQRDRWKRVLDAEENAIGEALGQLFAKEYFNEKAKKRYEDMVEGVREAYRKRILSLDWMSDSTKQKALAKLAAISKKVGYPDKWKDFSSLKIDKTSFAGNIMRANEWWNNYHLAKLGKPVDRTEWDMTPQTYNAYYNPSNNEIVLPAGIFTIPGFRDEQLDDAVVYGYAGASTIGHEITHGFDDEGRQYDAEGNLKNWWSKEDEAQFKKRAQVLENQFSNMVVVDSLKINGKATLGENLADLGGILIGLDAFMQTESYKKGEKINGLTPLQRFFMGYALGWQNQTRKDELASRLLTDVHSPAMQRVNGPMPNVPQFYEAFSIKPGTKMYLPDSMRVRLW